MNNWHLLKDKKPPSDVDVLFCYMGAGPCIDIGFYNEKTDSSVIDNGDAYISEPQYTHWMLFPEYPEMFNGK